MEARPTSDAESSSTSQEIPRILLNLTIHYRVHMGSPLVPTLNSTPHSQSCFFRIHFNIILISALLFPKWSLSFGISYQNLVCIYVLSHANCMFVSWQYNLTATTLSSALLWKRKSSLSLRIQHFPHALIVPHFK